MKKCISVFVTLVMLMLLVVPASAQSQSELYFDSSTGDYAKTITVSSNDLRVGQGVPRSAILQTDDMVSNIQITSEDKEIVENMLVSLEATLEVVEQKSANRMIANSLPIYKYTVTATASTPPYSDDDWDSTGSWYAYATVYYTKYGAIDYEYYGCDGGWDKYDNTVSISNRKVTYNLTTKSVSSNTFNFDFALYNQKSVTCKTTATLTRASTPWTFTLTVKAP